MLHRSTLHTSIQAFTELAHRGRSQPWLSASSVCRTSVRRALLGSSRLPMRTLPTSERTLFSAVVNVIFVSDCEPQGRAPKAVTFLECFAGLLVPDHLLLRFRFKRIRNGSRADHAFACPTLPLSFRLGRFLPVLQRTSHRPSFSYFQPLILQPPSAQPGHTTRRTAH